MSSIFTMEPLEDGGGIARQGIRYQDHVAIRLLLDMLNSGDIAAVWCETHDDQLVRYSIDGSDIAEFVQVKSTAHEQLWTVSLLTAQERTAEGKLPGAGTSLIEKQLARDRGDENVRFRIITFRDVKSELSVLKKALKEREGNDCDELAKRIIEKIGNLASPSNRDIFYWVRNTRWEVFESADSLYAKNLIALQRWCESELNAFPGFSALSKLYQSLFALVSELACAPGDRTVSRRITRQELIDWIAENVRQYPTPISQSQRTEIERVERESLARCEDLWLSLGVPRDEAYCLARNPDFGTVPDAVLDRLQQKFTWFVADYGSGKTLTMERLFQRILTAFRDGRGPFPIFIRAKGLNQPLRREVEEAVARVGSPTGGSLVILDAVDECGTEKASELLSEARNLSEILDGSCVLVTSTPSIAGLEDQRISLPPLEQEQALGLVSHFSGLNTGPLWHYPEEIRSAASSPLFATLLGLALRVSYQEPRSIGELLDSLVTRALRPDTSQKLRPLKEHLTALAVLSTDHEGLPVPTSEVSSSSFDFQPLLQSRLVKSENGCLGFSVSLIRCWFAAEALRDGSVVPSAILSDQRRFERWRAPLAIYLSNSSFKTASDLLAPLARENPAWASLILREALRDDYHWNARARVDPRELGEQLHFVFKAWIYGLGPVAPHALPCHSDGSLWGLRIFPENSLATLLWMKDSSPDSVEIPTEPIAAFLSRAGGQAVELWRGVGGNQPAWVWQITQRHIGKCVGHLIDKHRLMIVGGPIGYDRAWVAACDRLMLGKHSVSEIRLDEIKNPARHSWIPAQYTKQLNHAVAELELKGSAVMCAPYPQKDREPKPLTMHDFGFSDERLALRMRAVFLAALQGYKELVDAWFPKFANRLPLYVSRPVRIVGVVGNNTVSYKLIPCGGVADDIVEFSVSQHHNTKDFLAPEYETPAAARNLPFFVGESISDSIAGGYLGETPVTELAFDWLKSDLKAVGWIE